MLRFFDLYLAAFHKFLREENQEIVSTSNKSVSNNPIRYFQVCNFSKFASCHKIFLKAIN